MASSEDLVITFDKGGKLKSLEKMLRASTFVSWLLGAGIPRPTQCPKALTMFVKFINFGICSVIVAYGAIDFFFFGSVFKSDTFKIMYYSNKVVCYLSSYWYVFLGIVQYAKWPVLMEYLVAIDKKLKQCGVEKNNKPIIKFQIFAVLMVIVLGPISLASHVIYYYNVRPEDIFASDLLLYHTIAQSLAMNFSFDLIVLAVYTRFKAVNKGVSQVTEQFTPEMIIREIRRVREIHQAICSVVRYINGIHGVHLLLSSLNSFTMVVATLFRIYMGVVEGKYIFMMINNVIWLTYAGQFALTCCICTLACRESSKTGILLHQIILRRTPKSPRICGLYSIDMTRATTDPELFLRHEMNDFSSQLYHSNVAFSACEFFDMDNELLRSFIGVITTYLIILVQFYVPEGQNELQLNSTTASAV